MKTVLARVKRDDDVVVRFKLPRGCDAARSVPTLLAVLQYLGGVGASRSIVVEDALVDKSDSDFKTGFDGDGSDCILDLTVDGKVFKLPKEFFKDQAE